MEEETDLGDVLQRIRQHVDEIAHVAKHMHTRAVRVQQAVERPDMEIWAQPFKLHERAHRWAKKNVIASVCSLWQVHQVIAESAKKEGRVGAGTVRLTLAEAEILDLVADSEISIWTLLGRLPRFFV